MKNYILIVALMLFGAGEALGQVVYNGNGNSGFGGPIGGGTLTLSDNGTTITGSFAKGGGDFSDAMVIYLDTRSGGFSSTANFTDRGDGLRTAISVTNSLSDRTTVHFPTGFGADYAIALGPSSSTFGGLWELVENGSHNFVASVNLSPTNATSGTYTFDFDFSEVSTTTGIKFVAIYTSQTAFVSDEVIGTSSVSGNPGQNESITFTDYRLYQARASIANTAGWRMLSSPVSTTYANLLGPVWTQGATGSDAPSNGDPNVITYTDAGGFADVTDLTTSIPAGQGFIYQHFNDDDYDGTPNASATTLSVTGAEHPSGTMFTPTWDSGTEYAVAGNPFATTIDWDLVGRGEGVSAVVWVYDRNISAYINWNGTTGDLTDGLIAPFQGFWIEYTSAASTLTFETADKSTGATFYRKEVQPFVIALEGASGSYKSTAFVEFEESGSLDKGPKDALKFVSLSPSNLSVSTVLDGKAYSINHLPMLRDELMLPLDIQFTEGGVAELSVASLNLPEGWTVSLHDKVSGETYALTGDFRMDVALPALKASPRNPLDGNGQPMVMAAASDPRFTLIVDPLGTTSVDRGPETVGRMELEQNYPNPFNPSTQIRFTLQSSDVARLTVYDVLGREIAVLVNETLQAGSHSINFDASNLTSGVYVYKLEAGGQVMTKRMTLVK